jgi:hypothetical protein
MDCHFVNYENKVYYKMELSFLKSICRQLIVSSNRIPKEKEQKEGTLPPYFSNA